MPAVQTPGPQQQHKGPPPALKIPADIARATLDTAPPKPAERTLEVIDPTCEPNGKNTTRKHDGLDPDGTISVYEFKYRAKTAVPFRHAMVFLKSGFEVYDQAGNRMSERHEKNEITGLPVALLPNQCIADLGELSQTALVARCHKTPNGQHFSRQSDRGGMIEFLVAAASAAGAAAKPATVPVPPTIQAPAGELGDLDQED